MNRQNTLNRINELMARFVSEIKGASAMNLLDINKLSEDVLIPLFTEIYDHEELKNLNLSEGKNQPAIDLGDKVTKTAYQITSTKTGTKIKDTLEKFIENELYKEYDRLIIYILTEKQQSYSSDFNSIINGKFKFNKKTDILDSNDLLECISRIEAADSEKLQRIKDILEKEFGDTQKHNDPNDILEWIQSVNDLSQIDIGTDSIRINREKLSCDLIDFMYRGNGVIIGKPGVGKTYLIREIQQHLDSSDTPHLVLPIDQFGDGTTNDWQESVLFQYDVINRLKTIPILENKPILIFEAFDASRNEQIQKFYLKLIRRAILELNNWNIIVTVRTYDAKKSRDLLKLFNKLYDEDEKVFHVDILQYMTLRRTR